MVVINGKRCTVCPFLGYVNGVSYCRVLAGECAYRAIVDIFCRRNIPLVEEKQIKMEDLEK